MVPTGGLIMPRIHSSLVLQRKPFLVPICIPGHIAQELLWANADHCILERSHVFETNHRDIAVFGYLPLLIEQSHCIHMVLV